MSWRKRFRDRLFSSVAGLLVALLFLQSTHELFPNLIPPLFSVAEAAYNSIQPDGDGTVAATRTTCATAANYDCLNDGVATSSTPSTAGDYLTFAGGNNDYYTMQTLSNVNSVSTVYVPVYHRESATNMTMSVSLWDSTQTTQYGTTQTFSNRSASQWDTATISGLTLTQSQLDGLRVRITCTRTGGSSANRCYAYAMFAAVSYSENINVTVSSLGTQQDIDITSTSAYVGGAFSIVENTSSRSITSITIAEQGTVDAQNNLDNIKLYYELDTSSPYNCSSESFAGTETQYGSTDTDGFSSSNGTSAFTGSVTINTTQAMCVYVVLDVLSGATAGNTIEIQISNPTTDVVGSGSPVISPATAVTLPGTTTLRKTILTQENYHWRNDDGSESTASSATGGSENTAYGTMPKSATKRLRLAVSNEGNKTSSAVQYRLEYATKVTTCSAATGWTDVGASGGDFDMSDTGNLTNGNDTTNISVANGGVSDPNTTFLTPNGGVRDTSSQTGNITLTSTEFVELEYAIIASSGVTDGTTYCFRVTNAGTPLDAVTNYPEATIAADLLVEALGTQTSQVTIPTTGQYAGGTFRITDTTTGSDTITSVTITASGTIHVQDDLTNIKLRYDLDTTNPYTCDDTSYSSGDTQYGSTVANFNGSGQATFTGSLTNSPTQTVCFYVEYDVAGTPSNGEIFDIRILDASSNVVTGGGSTVAPAAPVDISGVTTLAAPYVKQTGYHWRNNDGDQAGATSATGGTENTPLPEVAKNSTVRLRFSVANTGLANAPEARYRLEWSQKTSICSAATGWERVDTTLDEWQMSPIANLTEGDDTTDIAVSAGGVSNGAATFLANNNGVNDTTDLTASSTLPSNNYLDLEYSISATDEAVQGATYCFRVTTSGTALTEYVQYAEATIKLDTDFKVQRGVSTITGDNITITAGVDYEAPAAASSSFIRITNTQLTGAGPNTGNSNSNADDVTVYITNPSNILTSITFARGTGAAGNTRVSWEIVEYTGVPGGENEIIVRRQEAVSYVSTNTTVSGTVTNTIVDDNDVVIFITGQFNADTGRNAYGQGFSTAAWNGTNNQADFTRGLSGAVSSVSYAIVEFTGSNWKIQRISHTYTAAGTVETSSMTAVNSLSRTFTHTQKRTPSNNHADIGHEVWLSGIGQVSFLLDAAAVTPGSHVSVAWVIENTQTQGLLMKVYRANSSLASGATAPQTNNLNIGATLRDLTTASLFVNNRSDGAVRSFPEPILGARILSTTQYELWRSDTSSNINYRTEVVEWPTAARKLEQNYFRIYQDNGQLKPTNAWPAAVGTLGENEAMTADDNPLVNGSTTRIRMTVSVTAAAMPAGLDSFQLQYGLQVSSCSAITTWYPLGDPGSTTAPWRGVNNTPADGTALSATDPPTAGDLLISIATVSGTYEEQNNTATNPYTAFPDDEVEYDWVVQHNGAADKSSYCFRMIGSDGTPFTAYNNYPVLRTVGFEPVIKTWRWYDDETSLTPSDDLAGQNVAPIDIANDNIIKLRVTVKEISGANGNNNKFVVQYSQYANFSQAVYTLTGTSSCEADSIWCYADGAGVDNALITSTVISDAGSCVSGVGSGCGTHNEGTSTVSATFDQLAYSTAEYEFTIQHAGARANGVYYFRLYDVTTDEVLGLGATSSYPSLVTEGPQLFSTVSGVDAGTTVGDVTSDATTTPTSIGFGSLPFNTSQEAIQQVGINTNATEGYQLFVYVTEQLVNSYGDDIPPITATNATPDGWNDACTSAETGCFGYHTTDATLENGSGRFAPVDSYAAFETTPREIMYSSIPANDTAYMIFRVLITEEQPAGDYETNIVYLAVPVF